MIELLSLENLAALLTLSALEIVLGIDNVIFIAIIVERLAPEQRAKARRLGLALAMVMRIALLLTISKIMSLTAPWFSLLGHDVSGRDLILLAGGLFLIAKATHEIHHKVSPDENKKTGEVKPHAGFKAILLQILVLDLVFSLDSVITAVGMAQNVVVMIIAIVIAVGVMLAFSGAIAEFIQRHPTFKMLALSFLLLIGMVLVADGLGKHIDKGYVYFAMAFSFLVEVLNMRSGSRAKAG